MSTILPTPRRLIENVADLKLPPWSDRRLQWLMDRQNDGLLGPEERDELESFVEMSESLALVRAEALAVLGRRPA